jgi:RNA polymerase sigma-70 factor (ECF subfamily)
MKYEYEKLADEDLFALLSENQEVSNLAFNELHKRYSKKMYSYLYRLLGDKFFIKDLYQEIFVKIYNIGIKRKEKQLNNFNAYIYQTAKNLCLNHFKSENKLPDVYSEYMNEIKSDDNEFDDDKIEILKKSVKLLPEIYREVIILSEFENLSNPSIAQITGDTEINVRVKLHRAKKMLREIYARMKRRMKIIEEND